MSSPPFDVAKAHRWFAIELNNRAWDLIESPARTAAETTQLLSIAHASRYHWSIAGTALQHLRADLLVAAAYLAANKPEISLSYAQQAMNRVDDPAISAAPFDRASAHGAVAAALAQLGDRERAAGSYELAMAEVAQFASDEDRAVFHKLYPPPA